MKYTDVTIPGTYAYSRYNARSPEAMDKFTATSVEKQTTTTNWGSTSMTTMVVGVLFSPRRGEEEIAVPARYLRMTWEAREGIVAANTAHNDANRAVQTAREPLVEDVVKLMLLVGRTFDEYEQRRIVRQGSLTITVEQLLAVAALNPL